MLNGDAALLLWIQQHLRTPLLTPAMILLTHLGDDGIFWLLLTGGLLIPRRTRRIGVALALSLACSVLMTNLLLKNLVARTRPYEVVAGLQCLIERQSDFSFPSGHASSSFAAAAMLFRLLPKRYGWPALLLAALISFSRLYVGVHYPTDVLAGCLIGLLSAYLARKLLRYTEGRLALHTGG